jgi:hypothetical protein
MSHVVLLGDSIFDNKRYVPDRPAVIEQLRGSLPPSWRASLLAVDGHMVGDVAGQLAGLPGDATHLVVSVGGNDALGVAGFLRETAHSVADVFARYHEIQAGFRADYRRMLGAVLGIGRPTAVCTIYDAVPGLDRGEVTALAAFNDMILREAFQAGLPVIDLRLICTRAGDYSHVSPIEPSAVGGARIARVIAEVVTTHDFSRGRTVVYGT